MAKEGLGSSPIYCNFWDMGWERRCSLVEQDSDANHQKAWKLIPNFHSPYEEIAHDPQDLKAVKHWDDPNVGLNRSLSQFIIKLAEKSHLLPFLPASVS